MKENTAALCGRVFLCYDYRQMDTPQFSTENNQITAIPKPYVMLTEVQRSYIDWKALGGIITDDDGVREVKVDELARMMGVTRSAFYKAKESIPNFWDLVAQRRKELGSQSRLARFHQVWYLRAIKMDNWQLSEAWARNFDPSYKEARQKVEHEVGDTFLDALNLARERSRQIENVQEGEVVDATSSNN